MSTTDTHTDRGIARRKGTLMGTRLLTARVELADAIVIAARAQRDEAAARGDRSLLAGCEVALQERIASARALRADLEARA